MRTSLNDIKTIEDYLLGGMAPTDALLFEVKILLDSDLKDNVQHQKNTYTIIREYSRQKLKAEIKQVQVTLTTAKQHLGFRQRIANFFKK